MCVCISKSNEVSHLREPHQAAAQKFDRSRFLRSTILPRKSHIGQKEPHALGAAAEWLLVTRCSCVSRVGCRMASGIVSDLSWCQKLQEQKCEKLPAVIRSKLFLHEYENNTHEAENCSVYECIRQQNNRITASINTAGRQHEPYQVVGHSIWQWNMNWIVNKSCRVSYIRLHRNSGACCTTAAWIVSFRCGRCCTHHIEFSFQRPCTVLKEKNLCYVAGCERTRACRRTYAYAHNVL